MAVSRRTEVAGIPFQDASGTSQDPRRTLGCAGLTGRRPFKDRAPGSRAAKSIALEPVTKGLLLTRRRTTARVVPCVWSANLLCSVPRIRISRCYLEC
jgi:hypothetical protein